MDRLKAGRESRLRRERTRLCRLRRAAEEAAKKAAEEAAKKTREADFSSSDAASVDSDNADEAAVLPRHQEERDPDTHLQEVPQQPPVQVQGDQEAPRDADVHEVVAEDVVNEVVVPQVQGMVMENDENAEDFAASDLLEGLVMEFASIKVTSDISDGAIEKLFRVFCKESPRIHDLLLARRITTSYKRSVRPRALVGCPAVFTSYVVLETHGNDKRKDEVVGLRTLPKEILHLPPSGNRRLLRSTSYVSIASIVSLYVSSHLKLGYTLTELKEHLRNAQLSADGVRESAKGTRTFIIVSLKLGECIYVVSILNPLIGDPENKPTPVDILR